MSRLAASRQKVVVAALKLAALQGEEESGSGHQDADLDSAETLLDIACADHYKALPQ